MHFRTNYEKTIDEILEDERKKKMGNDKIVIKQSGLGCLTVIGIVFVLLKALAVPPVASWSWIWVLCPFWISIAITFIVLFCLLTAIVLAAGCSR